MTTLWLPSHLTFVHIYILSHEHSDGTVQLSILTSWWPQQQVIQAGLWRIKLSKDAGEANPSSSSSIRSQTSDRLTAPAGDSKPKHSVIFLTSRTWKIAGSYYPGHTLSFVVTHVWVQVTEAFMTKFQKSIHINRITTVCGFQTDCCHLEFKCGELWHLNLHLWSCHAS